MSRESRTISLQAAQSPFVSTKHESLFETHSAMGKTVDDAASDPSGDEEHSGKSKKRKRESRTPSLLNSRFRTSHGKLDHSSHETVQDMHVSSQSDHTVDSATVAESQSAAAFLLQSGPCPQVPTSAVLESQRLQTPVSNMYTAAPWMQHAVALVAEVAAEVAAAGASEQASAIMASTLGADGRLRLPPSAFEPWREQAIRPWGLPYMAGDRLPQLNALPLQPSRQIMSPWQHIQRPLDSLSSPRRMQLDGTVGPLPSLSRPAFVQEAAAAGWVPGMVAAAAATTTTAAAAAETAVGLWRQAFRLPSQASGRAGTL